MCLIEHTPISKWVPNIMFVFYFIIKEEIVDCGAINNITKAVCGLEKMEFIRSEQ